jgi:acyl carrier protein
MAYDVSPERVGLQAALASRGAALPIGQFYGDARNAGFEYGAGFATVREAWLGQPGSGEAVARLAASPAAETPEDHPFRLSTILDGAFQTIRAAAGSLGEVESQATLVPRGIKSVTLAREMPFEVWCETKVQAGGRNSLIASIRVVDAAGNVIAQFEDLELYPMARLSLASLGQTVEGPKRDLASRRVTSLPAPERVEAVSKWLVDEIKEILGQAAEEINLDELDGSAAFIEIGLDSLLVTELQRRIQEKLEFRFKAMQGLDYQSVDSLARYITDEVLVVESVGGIMSGESKAEMRAALN